MAEGIGTGATSPAGPSLGCTVAQTRRHPISATGAAPATWSVLGSALAPAHLAPGNSHRYGPQPFLLGLSPLCRVLLEEPVSTYNGISA